MTVSDRHLPPPLRLTRALVDRLPPRTGERGPVVVGDPDPTYHDSMAAKILAGSDPPGTVWVFAAGSLIWNPRMEVAERRIAHLAGWRRAFCLTDRRYRGSPSAPGLMMSLDRGGDCTGVALRMDPGDDAHAALVSLLEKEPPVPPEIVTATTEAGPVQAILFSADAGFDLYRPEPEIEELAHILASAVGHVGTMAEYLLNTVTELALAGVHDPHLWKLQDMVADLLERRPDSSAGSPVQAKMNPRIDDAAHPPSKPPKAASC